MSLIINGTTGLDAQGILAKVYTDQLISTTPVGTSPLLVDSTTLVDNLNAEWATKFEAPNWKIREIGGEIFFSYAGLDIAKIDIEGVFTKLELPGTLWTWGYNYYGQLGDNTTTHKSSPVQTPLGAPQARTEGGIHPQGVGT